MQSRRTQSFVPGGAVSGASSAGVSNANDFRQHDGYVQLGLGTHATTRSCVSSLTCSTLHVSRRRSCQRGFNPRSSGSPTWHRGSCVRESNLRVEASLHGPPAPVSPLLSLRGTGFGSVRQTPVPSQRNTDSHAAGSQTSTRLIAPTTTQSLSRPAYDLRCERNRHAALPSGVSSEAPEASIRW